MSPQDKSFPKQHQERQPGREAEMAPEPESEARNYKGSRKLQGKIALITGGDSGIGRSAAIAFAKEGADVAIVYLEENEDAQKTKSLIEAEGRRCVAIAGDVGDEDFCKKAIQTAVDQLGGLDVLVNNAAEQHLRDSLEEIPSEQMERTFRTNIFSMFYMTKAALPHLKEGSTIVNSTSVTAYRGSPKLIDYSSTKGAIVSFTRSLSISLLKRKIRVNAVAPGPIWTPLIPASFSPEGVESFGGGAPMGRPGQPDEMAASYVFLASDDSSYMSGQVLHPNGGEVING